jgi:hypothetical protein
MTLVSDGLDRAPERRPKIETDPARTQGVRFTHNLAAADHAGITDRHRVEAPLPAAPLRDGTFFGADRRGPYRPLGFGLIGWLRIAATAGQRMSPK